MSVGADWPDDVLLSETVLIICRGKFGVSGSWFSVPMACNAINKIMRLGCCRSDVGWKRKVGLAIERLVAAGVLERACRGISGGSGDKLAFYYRLANK